MVMLKAKWPGLKTFSTLVLIVAGACGYVATDRRWGRRDGPDQRTPLRHHAEQQLAACPFPAQGFNWAAYSYAIIYLLAFTVDQVLIKKIVSEVRLTRWGLVYYNNLLALCAGRMGWHARREGVPSRAERAERARVWPVTLPLIAAALCRPCRPALCLMPAARARATSAGAGRRGSAFD
eukprot:gene39375-51177_t